MIFSKNNQARIYIPSLTHKQISSLEDYLNSHLDTSQKLGLYNKIRISKNKKNPNKNYWEIRFNANEDFDSTLFCGYISGFFNVLYKSK